MPNSFGQTFKLVQQELEKKRTAVPGQLDIYRTASCTNNLARHSFCMTLKLRNNHDIRNYLITTTGKKLASIPPEAIYELGPLEFWKQKVNKNKVIYFFDLIYEDNDKTFYNLIKNGYCVARNRMARNWGKHAPPYNFKCEKCRNFCHAIYKGNHPQIMSCTNCRAYYVKAGQQNAKYSFSGYRK